MANKARAIALDLINHQLKNKDIQRGFTLRILFKEYMFARQYTVYGYEGGIDCGMKYRHLEDAIECAKQIDRMCERSQNVAVREATNAY